MQALQAGDAGAGFLAWCLAWCLAWGGGMDTRYTKRKCKTRESAQRKEGDGVGDGATTGERRRSIEVFTVWLE
jgi:hypothetical protein